MAVSSIFIFALGILPFVSGGNQCSYQFPNRGYCVDNRQLCPTGSHEYTRLSNGLGCPSMTSRCCVTGGIGGINLGSDRSQCGMGSLSLRSRIFNGVDAAPCDWPFLVSIRRKLRNVGRLDYFGSSHMCGGVIIDRLWVLTSAFCLLASTNNQDDVRNELLVVAGEYNISGIDTYPDTGTQQEQIINVARAIIHPSYAYSSLQTMDFNNSKQVNSDNIGLIKLAQPIAGRCSGVVCLPTQREAQNNCAVYKECVITGWGQTSPSFSAPPNTKEKLKQGRVKLASKKGCDLVSKRLSLDNVRPRGSLCKVPDRVLTDGCTGDEGGPVMCSTGSNWVVRGILPVNVCKKDKYNVFVTDVSDYLIWINNTMNYWGTRYG